MIWFDCTRWIMESMVDVGKSSSKYLAPSRSYLTRFIYLHHPLQPPTHVAYVVEYHYSMMIKLLLFYFVICVSSLHRAFSFSVTRCITITSPRVVDFPRLRSTNDELSEIAALEERLRKLKEQGGKIMPAIIADPEEDLPEGESEDSVMFSERWKEAKDGYLTKQKESSKEGIGKVGLVLGFIVLLGVFSQVPIGEENLLKYQAVKGDSSRIDLGDLNPVQ